jgi:hypothetical protein
VVMAMAKSALALIPPHDQEFIHVTYSCKGYSR